MEKSISVADSFRQFAKNRLKNHEAELNNRYWNESIDRKTLQQAYNEHQ